MAVDPSMQAFHSTSVGSELEAIPVSPSPECILLCCDCYVFCSPCFSEPQSCALSSSSVRSQIRMS